MKIHREDLITGLIALAWFLSFCAFMFTSSSCACFYPSLDGSYNYLGYTPGMECVMADDGDFVCGADDGDDAAKEYHTGQMHKRGPSYDVNHTVQED